MRNMSLTFASGCFGGIINSMIVWLSGTVGITQLFGVAIAPHLTSTWLYQRIVWGGLWGLLFLLPIWKKKYFYRGLMGSLFPTLVQLLIIFPLQAKKGIMGVELGRLTPVLVTFFNFIWGISTIYWLKLTCDRSCDAVVEMNSLD
ncbi:hypothetical protein [Calothrix sp. NIES-3974]|uniref:hypothetical protein n=1 Tax=Calothrix sp. NIES-3974 TaxID=2005462 RepID=UPI000BBC642D|nr:hypothetical protein [Calothrix sp. NIES-3974]